MKKADLTIITPVFNGETYLDEVLESVIGQQNIEIKVVIVNDGSTDLSLEIAQKWRERFPDQIKVIDRPVIRSLDIKVISPGYSKIPIVDQKDNGNISALVGSNVEISLLSNKELKSISFTFH